MENVNKIIELLNKSHSQFHAIKNCKELLLENNIIELEESKDFDLKPGNGYFIVRNGSSLISFVVPKNIDKINSFKFEASHSDSPTFKIKPNPIIEINNTTSLNVEPYGGMIMYSFMDRLLSIAGRLQLYNKENNTIQTNLVDINEDLLFIPSLPIHMNRNCNSGYAFNPAIDLIPVLGMKNNIDFNKLILEKSNLDSSKYEVLSHDLFIYNRDKTRLVGLNKEFVSSPKIDNLTSVYTSLIGLINSNSKESNSINIVAIFDNEETGSLTRQGACSTFLKDVLFRIKNSLNISEENYLKMIAKSSLLSIDNAHALNPNHQEYADRTSRVFINEGIVIKYNANQSYTSDAISSSLVKLLCKNNDLKYQEYTNRSDLRGGSTLGNLSNSQVSLISCDIGLPQFAMHSSNEFCGTKDINDMIKLCESYFSTNINIESNKITLE